VKEQVAIIGAGASGLTAAYRLLVKRLNYRNITIYDARPRAGGRFKTGYLKSKLIELGAQNIRDGGKAPHILALAQELGVEVETTETPATEAFYDSNGFYEPEPLPEAVLVQLDNQLNTLVTPYNSMQTVLDALFENPILTPQQKRLKGSCAAHISSYEGVTLDRLAAYNNVALIRDALRLSLLPNVWTTFKGGASTLINALVHRLGDRLQLNHVLQRVSNTPNNQIQLDFQNGKIATCDKLIMAIPTPCYQDIHFSEGTLSTEKLARIHQVQYGTNAKIIVPVQCRNIPYETVVTNNLGGTNTTLISWLNPEKDVLTLYFRGDDGQGNIKALYADAIQLIKSCYQDHIEIDSRPPVRAIEANFAFYDGPVIQTWMGPYSRGAYSSCSIDLQKQGIDTQDIFAPVNDRFFFIGEHATIDPEYVGTMEAAVESADRLACLFEQRYGLADTRPAVIFGGPSRLPSTAIDINASGALDPAVEPRDDNVEKIRPS